MTEQYNYGAIRKLIDSALSDEELSSLCFDHFSEVYDKFASGQSRNDRILLFVDYIKRHEVVDILLHEIEKINPHKYNQFKSQLQLQLKNKKFQAQDHQENLSKSYQKLFKALRHISSRQDRIPEKKIGILRFWLPLILILFSFYSNLINYLSDSKSEMQIEETATENLLKRLLPYILISLKSDDGISPKSFFLYQATVKNTGNKSIENCRVFISSNNSNIILIKPPIIQTNQPDVMKIKRETNEETNEDEFIIELINPGDSIKFEYTAYSTKAIEAVRFSIIARAKNLVVLRDKKVSSMIWVVLIICIVLTVPFVLAIKELIAVHFFPNLKNE